MLWFPGFELKDIFWLIPVDFNIFQWVQKLRQKFQKLLCGFHSGFYLDIFVQGNCFGHERGSFDQGLHPLVTAAIGKGVQNSFFCDEDTVVVVLLPCSPMMTWQEAELGSRFTSDDGV